MGTGISSVDKDLISINSLYRSMLNRNLALNFQINKLGFRDNFYRTFSVSTNGQAPVLLCKAISRKISEVRKLKSLFRNNKRRVRKGSNFLTILAEFPLDDLLVYIISHKTHSSLVEEESQKLESTKRKLDELMSVKQNLQRNLSEISVKLKEFEINSVKLSKLKTEVKDLKHYKSHLLSSKQFLRSKKGLKYCEKYGFDSQESSAFLSKLYLLKQSRILADDDKEKLFILQNRINEKYSSIFCNNDKVVEDLKSENYISKNQILKKLEGLLKHEETLKEKLGYWQKQLEDIAYALAADENLKNSKEKQERGKLKKNTRSSTAFTRISELNKEWDEYNLKYKHSMNFFSGLKSKNRKQVNS